MKHTSIDILRFHPLEQNKERGNPYIQADALENRVLILFRDSYLIS